MQPKTEGLEEQGPSGVPFINDPLKPASQTKPDEDSSETQEPDDDLEEQ